MLHLKVGTYIIIGIRDMNKLVIFLDLDGSLKSEYDENGPYETSPIFIQSGEKMYIFAQRPHLHEFLDSIHKKAELILTTFSGGGYARKVLSSMNIQNYFSRIIAAEDFKNRFNFKQGYKYILIDNNSEIADKKVEALKGMTLQPINLSIWIIDTYHGSKEDKTLLELKEEIEKL